MPDGKLQLEGIHRKYWFIGAGPLEKRRVLGVGAAERKEEWRWA